MTFYLDPARPTGVNNLQLPNASMPHVLGELQGWQKKVETKEGEAHEAEGGHGSGHGPKLELAEPGSLQPGQYEQLVKDLTNFLTYAAEPARLVRFGLGTKVIFFLLMFTGLAYLLKQIDARR
jgi:ubiquinol-cytochrome c reductase cytochrome c1 subunit